MDAGLMVVEDEVNGNLVGRTDQRNQASSASSSRSRASSNDSFTTADSKKSLNDFEGKKLNRGISRATDNVNLVSQARSEIIVDTTENEFFIETPVCTFTLPDLTSFPPDFRLFLEKDLIAVPTQMSLEQANRLNWWTAHCHKLWPLSTSGDGNCLLHAASLGMWGFHDRLLTLRKALYDYLSLSPRVKAIWNRWIRHQSVLNQQAGLVYSQVEWRQEWNAIVNMASSEPRLRRLSIHSDHGGEGLGNIYESLEEIHVLALAHVLRRTIIVVADTMLKDMTGEALAPIPFGGIYLPLECSPDECHKAPLLLAYDGGHFSALVSMDTPPNGLASAIPLTDIDGELLPLQFSVDPGNAPDVLEVDDLTYSQKLDLLTAYLDVIRIEPASSSPTEESKGLLGSFGKSVGQKLRLKLTSKPTTPKKSLLCSVLHSEKRPDYHDTMIKNYLQTARQRFEMNNTINKEVTESNKETGLRYGAGNSQFYTEVDSDCHDRVANLVPQSLSKPDTTLYLGKSTFYQVPLLCKQQGCCFYGNPQTRGFCSKCFRLVEPPLD